METSGPNGRRWYDSAKVIWGLFGVVGVIIMAVAGTLWATVGRQDERGYDHESRLRMLEEGQRQDRQRWDKFDTKIEAKFDAVNAKLDGLKKP